MDTSHTTVGVSNTSVDVGGSVNTQPQKTTGPESEQSSSVQHNTESMPATQGSTVDVTNVPETEQSNATNISINISESDISYTGSVSVSVSVSVAVDVSVSVSQSVSVSVSLSTSESTTSSSFTTTVSWKTSVYVPGYVRKSFYADMLHCFPGQQYKYKLFNKGLVPSLKVGRVWL